jgi:hypothetical protein
MEIKMTGYWELRDNLDPLKCLMFGSKDDFGDWNVDLKDIVELSFDPHREPTDTDYEFIVKMTRDGYQSGQFDSGVDY